MTNSNPQSQPNTTPIKDIDQELRTILWESLDNLNLDELRKKLRTYIDNKILEARIGWQLELPDLPHFQIQMFGTKDDRQWISPIYDTENLPAQLNKSNQSKG